MKKFIILPVLLSACCLLTGCLGLAVAHPRQKCTEQFSLGNRGVVSNAPAATPLTVSNVLELWGQPDSKRNETNDVTVWQYRGKMGWTIVMPAYVIGVPIPVPSGHDQVELYFQDGIARKASRPVMVTTGVFIGLPGIVCAWEKEDDGEYGNMIVGSGFDEKVKPVQATP